jgi:hypothetical protein
MVAGCARIADPKPPEVRVPAAVGDLAARQAGGEVILTLSPPGKGAAEVRALEVFRLTEDAPEGAPPDGAPAPLDEGEFLERAERIRSIPAARFPEYLRGDSLVLRDEAPAEALSPPSSKRLRYAAVFVDGRRRAAGLGNQVVVRPLPVPDAPQGLAATVAEDGIVLEWRPPAEGAARVAGYNVYRAEGGGAPAPTPRNAAPLAAAQYRDGDFQFGKTYRYSVSTLAGDRAATVESAPSEEVAVTARDVFPPAPPEEFAAVVERGGVTFLWAPSPSPDVAGYRIFRKRRGGGEREPLQPGLLAGLSFKLADAAADAGGWDYEIEAVDGHGNPSAAVAARE